MNNDYLITNLKKIITRIDDTKGMDSMIADYDHWNRPINTLYIIHQKVRIMIKKLQQLKDKPNNLVKKLLHISQQASMVQNLTETFDDWNIPMNTLTNIQKEAVHLIKCISSKPIDLGNHEEYLGMHDGMPLFYVPYQSDEWWAIINSELDGVPTFELDTTSLDNPIKYLF